MKSKIALIIRATLGAFFIYSGLCKLLYPIEYYEVAIYKFQFAFESWVPFLAFIVPWMEFVMGSFVVIGLNLKLSALVLLIYSIILQIMMAYAMWWKLNIKHVGLFGIPADMGLFSALLLSTSLFLLLIYILNIRNHPYSFDSSNFLKN